MGDFIPEFLVVTVPRCVIYVLYLSTSISPIIDKLYSFPAPLSPLTLLLTRLHLLIYLALSLFNK